MVSGGISPFLDELFVVRLRLREALLVPGGPDGSSWLAAAVVFGVWRTFLGAALPPLSRGVVVHEAELLAAPNTRQRKWLLGGRSRRGGGYGLSWWRDLP